MALAAIAGGCDSLMVEVHPNPKKALSDGAQSLTFGQFKDLMERVRALANLMGRSIS